MTIQNWTAYKDSLWDWKILNGCFGETKIEPTDIDGFVERNGHFLVLETKLPNVEIKLGQEITFSRLVQDWRFTALFIWGYPGEPVKISLWHKGRKKEYEKADMELLKRIVARWFEYADKERHGVDY
jgi:hypothetical protein